MPSQEAAQAIEAAIELPSIPEMTAKIRALCEDPECDAAHVGKALEMDPPLAAQVLKVANGACYGLEQPEHSIHRAAMVVGTDAIANLVLQTEIARHYEGLGEDGGGLKRLWTHSVLTALLARNLAGQASRVQGAQQVSPEELYTCGLLHDLGKLAMFKGLGQAYRAYVDVAPGWDPKRCLHERQEFGYTHTEVGAMIAYQWGLPADVQNAIECHHMPRVRLQDQPYTLMVSLADELARLAESGEGLDRSHYGTSPIFRYLGLSFVDSAQLARIAAGYHAELGQAF